VHLNYYYYYYYCSLIFVYFKSKSKKDAERNAALALLLTNETRIVVSAVITQPLKLSKRETGKESKIVHLHAM
jgi:predicted nucleic acid-binding protein